MIREILTKSIDENSFRYRGVSPGRIENFSDAVFALAITLLLISTSPPTNFFQIKKFLFELIPFVLCIVLIILIWYQHFIFYLRYGLSNAVIVIYNTLFLVIVLFYVYPLKFLLKLSLFPIAILFKIDWLFEDLRQMISVADMADLMIIYGLGASSVFFMLALMYRYALKCREHLALNEMETFDTKAGLRMNMLMGLVPFGSVLVAIVFYRYMYAGMFAGFFYFFYFPLMFWNGRRDQQRRTELVLNLQPVDVQQQTPIDK